MNFKKNKKNLKVFILDVDGVLTNGLMIKRLICRLK